MYEALDTRRILLKKHLPDGDNSKIAGLKIKFSLIKATHRGGTKGEENKAQKKKSIEIFLSAIVSEINRARSKKRRCTVKKTTSKKNPAVNECKLISKPEGDEKKDRHFEKGFEKLTSVATVILGHHITFIIALCTVIFWLTNKKFYTENPSLQDSGT
jgi:hypothetical protein